MRLPALLKRCRILLSLLFVSLLARLVFFFDSRELWWDSGVYISMARYVFSAGQLGLWEHIRPVFWPVLLGAGWKVGLDTIWFARVLELFAVLASAWFVYLLGTRWFSARAGIIAAALWSFSPVVFYFGFHEYTEIPAVALVLGAMLAMNYGRWFVSGLLVSLAFLAKFPAGIFIAVPVIAVVLLRKFRPFICLAAGFAVPAGLFLLANSFFYGSALKPLLDASSAISQVLGCNVLRYRPWWQYFAWLLFDNPAHAFALLGIAGAVRKWKRHFLLPLSALVIPAIYFLQLHCREYRYLLLFLPFACLFTGHGILLAIGWLKTRRGQSVAFAFVLFCLVLVSAFHSIWFYRANEAGPDPAAEYYRWLWHRQVTGEVWSSHPGVGAFALQPVNKIYYPIYETGSATDFNEYLFGHPDAVGAVFLDNCGGGIVCPPDDAGCSQELDKMREFLSQNFRKVFDRQSGRCWYEIYER